MTDFRFAPSQTIRSGARADLGRLLSTTRYGSSTSDSPALYQSSSAAPIPRTTTIAKLSKVSHKVTPVCRKMLPSRHMPTNVRTTLDGLLKMKPSIQCRRTALSHNARNVTDSSSRNARIQVCLLCRRCRYCFCDMEMRSLSPILIQLPPDLIEIGPKFRLVPAGKRCQIRLFKRKLQIRTDRRRTSA